MPVIIGALGTVRKHLKASVGKMGLSGITFLDGHSKYPAKDPRHLRL